VAKAVVEILDEEGEPTSEASCQGHDCDRQHGEDEWVGDDHARAGDDFVDLSLHISHGAVFRPARPLGMTLIRP